MQIPGPTIRRALPILTALVMVRAVATSADLSLTAADIAYDSATGRLLLYVTVTRPDELLPAKVTIRDKRGVVRPVVETIETAPDGRARCVVPWPRVAPNAQIQVTTEPRRPRAESNAGNNSVTVTVSMSTALKNIERVLQRLLAAGGTGRAICLEAEALPVQHDVAVVDAPRASGGKAVRFTRSSSRLEADVTLAPGAYLLYAIGMGASPDQDAVSVALDKHAMRLFFAEKEWNRMNAPGNIVILEGKTQRLVIRFAEPNVLVDKVCIVPNGVPD